jgi:hypothetical protein
MIGLLVGLSTVAVMYAFLFWCVYWVCASDMYDIFKLLGVVVCVLIFYSIRFEYVDDGKNNFSYGAKRSEDKK